MMVLGVMGQSLSQETRLLVLRSDLVWHTHKHFDELMIRLLRVDGIWNWEADGNYLRLSGRFTDFAVTLEAIELALREVGGVYIDNLELKDADDLTRQAHKVAAGAIVVGDCDLL